MKSIEEEFKIFFDNIAWLRNHYEIPKERMTKIMNITVDMLDQIESGKLPDDLTVEAILNTAVYFRIVPKDLLSISLTEQ